MRPDASVVVLAALFHAAPAVAQRDSGAAAPIPAAILESVRSDAIEAHTRFLADELLRGRAPATDGGTLATRYVAAQFQALGLVPGGDNNSYLQPVELIGSVSQTSLVVAVGRQTMALRAREDFVAWPARPESSLTVDGEIVFAGYGVFAPEWSWDDFKGTPLAGKVLLVLGHDPGVADASRFHGPAVSYYGWWTYKLEQAARLGAAGVIIIHDDRAPFSWSAIRNTWSGEVLRPPGERGTTLRFAAWITREATARMLRSAGVDFDALLRRAALPDFRPMAFGAHAAVHIRSRIRNARSANVIGLIPGSDAELQGDAVVITAPYDYLGIREHAGPDSILNGVQANAAGVGVLLGAARALVQSRGALRRSVLFLATTASTPGLLGAAHYLESPRFPLERTAAVLSIERANLYGITSDVMGIGADGSSVDSAFVRLAAAEGLKVLADPLPAVGRLFASDVFAFARAGIPVVALSPGIDYHGRPPGWGLDLHRAYEQSVRHRPGDELRDDHDFIGARQQGRLLVRLTWELAMSSAFPMWKPESPFRGPGDFLRVRRNRRVSRN